MTSRNYRIRGYTLVELLIALVIGSAVLAATYASYVIVSKQYNLLSAYAQVQEMGIPALRVVARDIRMAGYKAVDANLQSNFGAIVDPILITDSGNACCDSVEIVYDVDLATRQRTTYYVAPRTSPARNALFMSKDEWDPNTSAWVNIVSAALVADYIEDLQMVGSSLNSNNDPTLVDISMIFRNKNGLPRPAFTYNKPSYDVGNYAFTANDTYHRDEFNATVNIRNLREIVY